MNYDDCFLTCVPKYFMIIVSYYFVQFSFYLIIV